MRGAAVGEIKQDCIVPLTVQASLGLFRCFQRRSDDLDKNPDEFLAQA